MSLLLVSCLLLALPSCLAQSSTLSVEPTETLGAPESSVASAVASQSLEACGQINSILASYAQASPSPTSRFEPQIDVQLAQDCLDSVALDQNDATNLIDGLSAMLEFQSDLEFLINPPAGYLLAGVDLQGELADLREQVISNNITNEIVFETAVTTILARAHDGHLTYSLDGLSILNVLRQTGALVSVSLDGFEIPHVYLYTDVVDYANGTGPTPVAIAQINGVDAVDYILYVAQNGTIGGLQDPDALYNSFMWQWNGQGTSNTQGYFPQWVPAPFELYTNVTFANGTTVNSPNFAFTSSDFSSVTDGDSFYQSFLNVSSQATTAQLASATATASESAIPTSTAAETAGPTGATSIMGYPMPTVISSDAALSGYFLEDEGFEDTAVLVLRSMSEDDPQSFQASLTEFLDACRANNKQQLVIDVSGNGGGVITLGYDLIKQLFPSIDPYGAGNFRAHEGFRLLGETITNESIQAQQDDPDNYTDFVNNGGTSFLDAVAFLDVNNTRFADFGSYYGPQEAANGYGNYTTLNRLDINNTNYDSFTSDGVVISGEGNNTAPLSQVFDNSNVILLSDGQCSSTCTIFSHFLKYQAEVKAIAIGGRPTAGPMQNIGGIKGSQVSDFVQLARYVNFAASVADNETLNTWEGTSVGTIYTHGEYLVGRTASKGQTASELSFNSKNNIAEGDTELVPLQFVYEAADCRLYYQPKHLLDITTIWKDAASQGLGLNGTEVFSACVQGSTNHPTSLSGDPELYAGGVLQNGSAVDAGPALLNQTEGDGNGTSTIPPYTGSARAQQASFGAVVGMVVFTVVMLA